MTVDDCAFMCNGVSKYFIFGTNATSDDGRSGRCSSDGRCRCFCETPNECVMERNSYDLYQFKRGNLFQISHLSIATATKQN